MCTFGPPWSSFHFPNPLASGKHKSDLFSYECICMFLNYDHSIIQSLCYTTWWFSISIPIKVTLEYSLLLSVTMQRHCIISMLPTLYSSDRKSVWLTFSSPSPGWRSLGSQLKGSPGCHICEMYRCLWNSQSFKLRKRTRHRDFPRVPDVLVSWISVENSVRKR